MYFCFDFDFILYFVKEIPEAFLLPSDAEVVKAVAGWAHCVSVTGNST